jgi:hypothetical protein
MTVPELAHFPPHPSFGKGAYRRRLVFSAVKSGLVAQVDDSFHSYWLILDHDGDEVTGVDAGFVRAPTDMCPGASAGLKAMVGSFLRAGVGELIAKLPRASNCTHLTDLAIWAVAHVGTSATWDIEVPDQAGSPVWIEIDRDGQVVHRWQVGSSQVVLPADFAEKPLMGGFINWARKAFSGDELLAATMLQRGLFVARGRQHIVDQGEPVALSRANGMAGMCWSYSEDRWLKGQGTLGYVRDFSRSVQPETLPQHVQDRLRDTRP